MNGAITEFRFCLPNGRTSGRSPKRCGSRATCPRMAGCSSTAAMRWCRRASTGLGRLRVRAGAPRPAEDGVHSDSGHGQPHRSAGHARRPIPRVHDDGRPDPRRHEQRRPGVPLRRAERRTDPRLDRPERLQRQGPDQTFTTPAIPTPVVETGPASEVTQNAARRCRERSTRTALVASMRSNWASRTARAPCTALSCPGRRERGARRWEWRSI